MIVCSCNVLSDGDVRAVCRNPGPECPRTPAQVYAYTRDTIDGIRALTGDPGLPLHVVGGIANRTSPAALASFLAAVSDCGASGTSLYDAATTGAAGWRLLGAAAPTGEGGC